MTSQRIPTRPRCHRCQRYITIDTDADDDLWAEVIGPKFGPGYICADCFTRAADERLIRWEGRLRLVPYSLAAQMDIQAEAAGPPTAAAYTALRLASQPYRREIRADTHRLQAALRRLGYDADLATTQQAYERRSSDWAAGWLIVGDSVEEENDAAEYLVEHGYLVAV